MVPDPMTPEMFSCMALTSNLPCHSIQESKNTQTMSLNTKENSLKNSNLPETEPNHNSQKIKYQQETTDKSLSNRQSNPSPQCSAKMSNNKVTKNRKHQPKEAGSHKKTKPFHTHMEEQPNNSKNKAYPETISRPV